MDFTLRSIDQPRNNKVKDDRSEGDSETYQAIQTVEQQPILTGIDKKRSNKTAECPECHKMMSKKTLEYSHKCAPPKPEPKGIPTEESLYEYIMQQDRTNREQQRQRKQEQFDRMMNGAF
jgi:hypothetical protein